MNVDDDQVFWFFEEPLKTFLNFFFVVELTFNKGKPRGSRHMFSQSHLACFLGGLFCSVVAERKVMVGLRSRPMTHGRHAHSSSLASEIFLAPESVGLGRISCVSSQL